MRKPRFAVLTLFALLGNALFTSACTKQNVGYGLASPEGEYELVSVNGMPVPADLSHDGATLRIRSGSLVIRADGSCNSRTVLIPPGGGEMVRDAAATYSLERSTLTLRWEGAGTTTGTIDGDTFTMDNEGMIFVYER